MKLAMIPLGLLIFACLFGVAWNMSVAGTAMSGSDVNSYGDNYGSGDFGGLDNRTLYSDGAGTEVGFEDASNTISFSLSGMMIAIFSVALALGAIVGIQVLGTGLSQFTVKSIVVIAVMMSIWLVFSTFGYEVFDTVPYFGKIIYFCLSLSYTFGVFNEIWL